MLIGGLDTTRSWRTAWVLLTAAMACGPQVELETDTNATATADTGSTSAPTNPTVGVGSEPTFETDGDTDDTGPVPSQRQVDILFVVDNSGSMGQEQAKLANAMDGLVAALEGATPPVDYRIAVTTTDNGNPWCGATSPEAGMLRATSCRSRQSDFVFQGAQTIDFTQEACLDVCPLETLGITDPWVDVQPSTGSSNVSTGQVAENLRCMLPQGINGCGFESQLESTWKAVRRSETEGESSYGFHRSTALLAIAIVSDEADCSYNNDHEIIFLPDGNRVFWSDPTSAAPSSAVCWNAGVACTGGACTPENYDVNGNPGVDDDQAVLRPLSRYTDALLEQGAYVFAIDGVNADGSVTYADSLDNPQYQSDYGIGPGCETADGPAVPPVRMRSTIATVSGVGNERSICDASYSAAMTAFVDGIITRLP